MRKFHRVCTIMSWSAAGTLALSLAVLSGCSGGGESSSASDSFETASVTKAFAESAEISGLDYMHGNFHSDNKEALIISGGVAAGDYDNDGFVDLYVVAGNMGTNKLFRNLGNGKFEEVGEQAGVAISNKAGSGPTFADIDEDGHLDLFIGDVNGANPSFFRNLGNGTFADITATCGIDVNGMPTFSAAFGDFDLDGDLDFCLAHWAHP